MRCGVLLPHVADVNLYSRVCRVLQSIGPTNTRRYHVAVYFRGERLATGIGHSIQQAEMNTAANALREKAGRYLLVLV